MNSREERAASHQISNSGLVASGDVYLSGTNVAGRDIVIHQKIFASEDGFTAPFELPSDIEDFTDREALLAAIEGLLTESSAKPSSALRIVVISGKGGIGKTTLAVHTSHRLRTEFPDGQLYVNLRGAEAQRLDPSAVLSDFLRATGLNGVAIPQHLDERARCFRARLANRRVLVVLDNAADEAQVRPLLPGSANCQALISSRRRLSGLEGAYIVDVDIMEPEAALELLSNIVGADRVAIERDSAETIVRLCGYLPLAVRIAGARLASKPHWSLSRLAGRLSDERRRLAELKIGDLEVRASFALSYLSRDNEEQRAFRLLGILKGPDLTVWLAAAILDRSVDQADELIESLAEAQLLEVIGEDRTAQLRYRYHDLLGTFARELLRQEEAAGVQQEGLRRAVIGYLSIAERADALLELGGLRDIDQESNRWYPDDPEIKEALLADPVEWFDIERPNLVSAVNQAYEAEFWDLTCQLANSLPAAFEMLARWDDWEQVSIAAVESSRLAGRHAEEIFALRSLGTVNRYKGRFDVAARLLEESLAGSQQIGDRRGEAHTLISLGDVFRYLGRFEDGISLLTRAATLCVELADRRGEAQCLGFLGNIYREQSRWHEAMISYEKSISIVRALGDRHWVSYMLRELGIVYREEGRLDEAMSSFGQSLAMAQQIGNRHGEAHTQREIGVLERERSNFGDAADRLSRALGAFRDLSDRFGEAYTLRAIGILARTEGHLDAAGSNYRAALELFEELGVVRGQAYTLASLGELDIDQGHFDEAVRWLERSLTLFRQLGDRLAEGRALLHWGEAVMANGDSIAARRAWETALAIFEEIDGQDSTKVRALLEGTGDSS